MTPLCELTWGCFYRGLTGEVTLKSLPKENDNDYPEGEMRKSCSKVKVVNNKGTVILLRSSSKLLRTKTHYF